PARRRPRRLITIRCGSSGRAGRRDAAGPAMPWETRQIAVGELCRLPLTGVRVRDDDFLAGCRRGLDLQLRLGRALEMIGRRERLGDVAPGREEAVVAQHEHWMVADAALQPLALVHVERDTFVNMVAEAVVEAHRPLAERQEPIFERADR